MPKNVSPWKTHPRGSFQDVPALYMVWDCVEAPGAFVRPSSRRGAHASCVNK